MVGIDQVWEQCVHPVVTLTPVIVGVVVGPAEDTHVWYSTISQCSHYL